MSERVVNLEIKYWSLSYKALAGYYQIPFNIYSGQFEYPAYPANWGIKHWFSNLKVSTSDIKFKPYIHTFTRYDCRKKPPNQIDSSTIDGNVEFVHSQYSCILSLQVSIYLLPPIVLDNLFAVNNWSTLLSINN